MDGIIVINKPEGVTSHHVVKGIRKLFPGVKAGHSGTLDPMATGVLPVCTGKATRLVEYIIELPKSYRAEITLGKTTDTEDATGKVLSENAAPLLDRPEIEKMLKSFTGEIEQLPPQYSAVKYKGKPLYHWARKGEETPRQFRKVKIYDITLLAYSPGSEPKITIDINCSKGTYIRTLAADIGKEIGCGAYLSALSRMAVGPYLLSESKTPDQAAFLASSGRYEELFQPMDTAVMHLPKAVLEQDDLKSLQCGRTIIFTASGEINTAENEVFRIYNKNNEFRALARFIATDGGGVLKTVKYLEG
ncbi:MAG: tRNA pseudouridine(55) synthase TruB [Dethiobacteria bacterium]|nr:tRNA pseudouridine(55) synthase TruB [Bacillota bacterium]